MTLTPLLLLLLGCPHGSGPQSAAASAPTEWLITPEEAALPPMDAGTDASMAESAPEIRIVRGGPLPPPDDVGSEGEGEDDWGSDGGEDWGGDGENDVEGGGLGLSGTGVGGGGTGDGYGMGAPSSATQEAPLGPIIQLDAPSAAVTTSPVRLKVSLAPSEGGSEVKRDSLQVTYLRGWGVNITPRVLPYATDTGFDYPGAPMPPGDHAFEVYVEDVDGNATTHRIDLSVR